MIKKAVVVVVAATAALVAVWWLRRDPAAPATASHEHGRGDHADLSASAARGSDAPEDQAPLLADDPPGTLRLEGQVVDGADDHPVPGAVVTIDAHPLRTTTTD